MGVKKERREKEGSGDELQCRLPMYELKGASTGGRSTRK
jgi:hypothetical protein